MDKHEKSGLALAGVITGAIAVALSAIPIINNFAFVLAALALVFGVIGMRQVKKGKRHGNGRAIAAIVLAIIAIVTVLITQSIYGKAIDDVSKDLDKASSELNDSIDKSSGKKTDELLKNDVAVDIGEFSATKDQYGLSTTALPVNITNKNAAKKSYSVQIEAVDASGARIDDDTVYANDLNSGQSQAFKAFEYVDSAKLEALKTATFKILSVSQN